MTKQKIPAAPLALGLAGLIPFVWGTLSLFIPALQEFGSAAFGARFVGPYVQVFYGAIILAFMSGVLWGFATNSSGREAASAMGSACCLRSGPSSLRAAATAPPHWD